MYMYAEPLDLCVGNVTVGYINAYTANTLGLLQGAKSKRADNVLIHGIDRELPTCGRKLQVQPQASGEPAWLLRGLPRL
jgi:hypothetical protein